MGDPQNGTQGGVEDWSGMASHSQTPSDNASAVEQENELLKGRPPSEYRVARSKAGSRVTLGRLQSSRRLGKSRGFPGIAALGLLLVSLVAVRLTACFKALALSRATQRGYSSGVTSRRLAWGEDDDDVPLLGSLDDGEPQGPSAQGSATSRYRTGGFFSSPAVCSDSFIDVIHVETEVLDPEDPEAPEPAALTAGDLLFKKFLGGVAVLLLLGALACIALAISGKAGAALIPLAYALGGTSTVAMLTTVLALVVRWILKRQGKADLWNGSSPGSRRDSRDIL